MTYPDRSEELTGATVRCYVNGILHTAEEELQTLPSYARPEDTWWRNDFTRYHFNAALHPGDAVRLEAAKGSLNAYAELTVPEPASIVSLDTTQVVKTYVVHSYNGEEYTYESRILSVETGIRDIPGEDNYYYLDVRREYAGTHHFLDENGLPARPDSLSFDRETPYIETEHDPVLNDGYAASPGEDGLFSELFATNEMLCFPDRLFQDGETVLHFSLYDNEAAWTDATSADFDVSLSVSLQTIGRDYYNYLRAINNMETYGYNVSPIIEPTMLPNNVKGGYGMVSVSAGSSVVLPLKTIHVDRYPEWGY